MKEHYLHRSCIQLFEYANEKNDELNHCHHFFRKVDFFLNKYEFRRNYRLIRRQILWRKQLSREQGRVTTRNFSCLIAFCNGASLFTFGFFYALSTAFFPNGIFFETNCKERNALLTVKNLQHSYVFGGGRVRNSDDLGR